MSEREQTAIESFTATASGYDATREQLIPGFDRFYGTAIEALGLVRGGAGSIRRVLDLGGGTGLLSGFVRQALPAVELVLVDGSTAMLERARERLGDDGVTYLAADLRATLPDGPFDAVVSALAVHHLADDDKRGLYGRVLDALRPGGAFVHAEQVLGPTPELEAHYWSSWLRRVRATGISEEDLAASLERQALDAHSPLEPQLAWLRELGYEGVDCLWKDGRFATTVALAP